MWYKRFMGAIRAPYIYTNGEKNMPSNIISIIENMPQDLNERDDVASFAADLASALPREVGMQLAFQIFGEVMDPEAPQDVDQHFWLDFANILGPEYAQSLYHGVVFATRVA
jgi:hypothetical protein